jgi:glycosyltransferase involved in cell wall biosynthesis
MNRVNISVVIPAYNRVDLLPRALDSVLLQTLAPGQVVVVDDGSDDTTREMVAENYPGIDYIYQQNKGVSAARNTGIQAAGGDWVALLDSDDAWLPEKLLQQAHALERGSYKVCHTNETWIRDGVRVNQMTKHEKHGGWIYPHCLPLCAMSPSSVLLSRAALNDVGLFNESLPACEDYDMWLRLCSRYQVLLVDEPLVTKYGGHEDQLSRKYWGMDRFRIQSLENMLIKGSLGSSDYSLTLEMLLRKLRILRGGAIRHRNHDLISTCDSMLLRWAGDSD